MAYLVTGAAGFIGFHTSKRLLDMGGQVIGYDNVNDYYSVALKEARLRQLQKYDGFTFVRADLTDKTALDTVFSRHNPSVVIHLAAQAGVRYSLQNPDAYIQSNIIGFTHILECCRHHRVDHLLYASSSSVYGANKELPFSVADRVDNPVSLYAATKKSNELMAHTYSHLFRLPTTGIRFFTVYGPWGRPDMAAYLFLEAIQKGEPIKVFNDGEMMRDFTYIDDAVKGVVALIDKSGALRTKNGELPYKIYNIGNNKPERLMDFIGILEELTGKKAVMDLMPLQPGDVPATYADIDDLVRDTGVKPETPLHVGLKQFVEWWGTAR
jgi:UDP-glucuronate 4-epimerase